jgi:hypothetical protein
MLIFNTNVECVVFYKMINCCLLYKLKIIVNNVYIYIYIVCMWCLMYDITI